MEKQYYVYIVTNQNDRVLYIGVTNNLMRRVYEHKNKLVDGFTTRYNVNKLVYYGEFGDIKEAIAREKQLKSGSRSKKVLLIDTFNPGWVDLYK